METLNILVQDFHRNGVGGAPFNVYLAKDSEGDVKLIIAFEEDENTAVFSLQGLAHGDISFHTNSWRGDVFRDALNRTLSGASVQN